MTLGCMRLHSRTRRLTVARSKARVEIPRPEGVKGHEGQHLEMAKGFGEAFGWLVTMVFFTIFMLFVALIVGNLSAIFGYIAIAVWLVIFGQTGIHTYHLYTKGVWEDDKK